jgi:alpha-N-acetylglucosaminidase
MNINLKLFSKNDWFCHRNLGGIKVFTMKKIKYLSAGFIIILVMTFIMLKVNKENPELMAAKDVITRVLPEYSGQFVLHFINSKKEEDYFEVYPENGKIHIAGTSGVAICSGFNYYLKHVCNSTWNWRCGNNLKIESDLPLEFERIKKESPFDYRYIFNYCTFSYSMAFWDWEQWERMIDWMAMNGINMPLAPMGQEIIWQRVFRKFGLNENDLKDFFVGPAYNAFGRMGCIDGFGGPLPQSWINNECELQKKILKRERSLGMKPVLQGFTGHIPPAFAAKNPGLKLTRLKWLDFEPTYLLDWEDPMFRVIGMDFIKELEKEYGTDHLYAIDQFIEMEPARGDTSFLRNMSRTIFNTISEADPEARWVIQTWPFKELNFWNQERTKAYFDGVSDERMIALELMGESWPLTGWYKQDGWYGKPWVWSVISNFGDNVSMFGGLPQINENLRKALESPYRKTLKGMGLMMEGLDYNPVTYQLVTDLMWEKEMPALETWKEEYLRSRYGKLDENVKNAWGKIFGYYYVSPGQFQTNPIIARPGLTEKDIRFTEAPVKGLQELLEAGESLKDNDAYNYDIVNISRQVFGQYTGHILFEITNYYKNKDLKKFEENVKEFTNLALMIEKLTGSREEFLFGKWLADSRERAGNEEERKLYEWNARAIVTTWGGRILYGYAIKDWSGLYSDYYLPKWEKLFSAMRDEISGGNKLNPEKFRADMIAWEDNWISVSNNNYASSPTGNSIELAKEIWAEYGEKLLNVTSQNNQVN